MVENNMIWDKLASDLESTVNEACNRFKGLPAETIEARPESGAWSVKEILGHLVDSASNNHQRFVRLQIADNLVFPDYPRHLKDHLQQIQQNISELRAPA